MVRIVNRCVSALMMTGALAGCTVDTQNHIDATSGANAPLSAAEWSKFMDADRNSVRQNYLPKVVLLYDLHIQKLVPEGQEILASHDQVRARDWSKRIHAVMDAKNKAIQEFSARMMAKNGTLTHPFGGFEPDNCRSESGKNICAPQVAQPGWCQQSSGGALVPC